MAGFGDFIKKATEKASDVLQILRISDTIRFPGKEGDIVYSKNNVCVHPSVQDNEPVHVPGYLTLHCQKDETLGVTIVLQWLPNATLERSPGSLKAVSSRKIAPNIPRSRIKLRNLEGTRKKRHLGRSSSGSSSSPPVPETSESQTNEEASEDEFFAGRRQKNESKTGHPVNVSVSTTDESSSSVRVSLPSPCRPPELRLDNSLAAPSIQVIPNTPTPTAMSANERYKTFNMQWAPSESGISARKESSDHQNSGSPATSGADEDDVSDETATPKKRISHEVDAVAPAVQEQITMSSTVEKFSSSYSSDGEEEAGAEDKYECGLGTDANKSELPALLMSYRTRFGENWGIALDNSTPEEYARQRNMMLADGIVNGQEEVVELGQKRDNDSQKDACLFSIDLGKMRSFRLFFDNADYSSGQLVITSLNSRYKILHFHNGGLEKLSQIFEQWGAVAAKSKKGNDSPLMSSLPLRQFAVLKTQVDKKESHPEEGLYQTITSEFWRSCMNQNGQIEDDVTLRKIVFFGGIDPTLRKEAWTFLLSVYPWKSTFEEREQIRNDLFLEYQNIRKRRFKGVLKMGTKAWQYVDSTIAKDVVRTDRNSALFKGDNNPNLEKMRNILLNYASFCPQVGYIQGMSDMLASVLSIIQDESDAFWCFAGLMQRSIFTMGEKASEAMDSNITCLRCLLKLIYPQFYEHLISSAEPGLELLYAHRWILLCFKREFGQSDAMQIWECCWSNYQTHHFHLFVCLAIICLHGEDALQQNLPYDEILLYFGSLAMHMNVGAVLTKARGLLYQFERLEVIPCTLANLCNFRNSGSWETSYLQPTITCTKEHPDNDSCPYYEPL